MTSRRRLVSDVGESATGSWRRWLRGCRRRGWWCGWWRRRRERQWTVVSVIERCCTQVVEQAVRWQLRAPCTRHKSDKTDLRTLWIQEAHSTFEWFVHSLSATVCPPKRNAAAVRVAAVSAASDGSLRVTETVTDGPRHEQRPRRLCTNSARVAAVTVHSRCTTRCSGSPTSQRRYDSSRC